MKLKYYKQRLTTFTAILLATMLLTGCSDSGSGSGSDSSSALTSPTANAGENLNVSTGEQVELTGEASFSNESNQLLTYSWKLTTKPTGSEAVLSDSKTVNPTFIADFDGEYTIELVVNNGEATSNAAYVTVTASTANSKPIADAGDDQTVRINTEYLLDASGSSDADGDELTYSWSLKGSPSSSWINFDWWSPKKEIKINPDALGLYVFELVVSDGQENSEPSSVTITVDPLNSIPVADAGEKQTILIGSIAALDGSGSTDADGDRLNYLWEFKSKPAGSNGEFDSATSEKPTFTADKEGDYVVSLVVNDGEDDSKEATVTIKAKPPHLIVFESKFFGSEFDEIELPVNTVGTISASVSGIPKPTSYNLSTFKLKAFGGNFTVINISAVDSNNVVTPFFKDLDENQVITEGKEIEFKLASPLTENKEANLTFEFTVLETSEKFKANYKLTTN